MLQPAPASHQIRAPLSLDMILQLLIAPLILVTCIIDAFAPLGVILSRHSHLQPAAGFKKYNQCSITYMTNQDDSNDDDEYNPRDNFGRSPLRRFQSSALKTVIETGDTIVCKNSVPSLSIYENASYEVVAIYAQSFNEETQQVEKTMMNCIDEDSSANLPSKSQLYVSLFSPVHHEKPVIVSPEEVGLATVRSELGNAVWLAIPGFFWIFLASSFYNIYHERTGGSFSDAFWGR